LWDDFPARTLRKYHGVVRQLRRSFEALRGDETVQEQQSVGDDVDIDALVEATVDLQSGLEMSERLFLKRHKVERDIAVMFMVDMSGSTKGWINDAEREALLLLCEALQSLGDHYAIYGFTSLTHKRCEVVRIKRFDETYSDTAQARISGITPQDYTRMGAPIRHLSKMLNEVDARIKLLVTISDGKQDDFDVYRGRYGIEGTRQALIEARRTGTHAFCITIDTEAKEYLLHMYGAANFVVVDQVAPLPQKLSDIYRKLTA
jgi:nitric oxide reductase NorD protein